MVEDEGERQPCPSTFNLPTLPISAAPNIMYSPEHPSGMATPPFQAPASVPFKWEEEPGKPRPCTDIIALPEPTKRLELPPCRMFFMESTNKIGRTPSPTTAFPGPSNILGNPKFSSSRFFREAQSSSDSSSVGGSPESAAGSLLGEKSAGKKTRGFFGRTLRCKSGKQDGDGGSFGFSPSSSIGRESDDRYTRLKMVGKTRRNASFSNFCRARTTHDLWVAICERLKQAMALPRKSSRGKRGNKIPYEGYEQRRISHPN